MDLPSGDSAARRGNARHRRPDSEPGGAGAVVDVSAAPGHWAERNGHDLYRRPSGPAPFRRPVAAGPRAADRRPHEDTGVLRLDFSRGSDQEVTAGPGGAFAGAVNGGARTGSTSGATAEVVEQRARHWTNVGAPVLRPRTSDRGEAFPPGQPDDPTAQHPAAGRSAAPVTDDSDTAPGAVPAAAPVTVPGPAAVVAVTASADLRPGPAAAPRAAAPTTARGAAPTTARAAAPTTARGAARVGVRPDRAAAGAGRHLPAPAAGLGAPDAPGSDAFGGPGDPETPEILTGPGVLGGPGREIRAHRAVSTKPGSGRHRTLRWATLVAVLLVIVAAAVVVSVTGSYRSLTAVLLNSAGGAPQVSTTAPLAGRTTATFELLAATGVLTVRSEDLGQELYRVSAAPDSGLVPQGAVDGDRVRLFLGAAGAGDAGAGVVEVVLNARVSWAVRLGGAAQDVRADLGRGPVTGVELAGATGRVDLVLPAPTDTVGVTVAGSVDDLVVHAPAETPVRLRLDSGAKTVVAGANTERDVPPGSRFTPRGWDADDRYDVRVTGRATLVTVDVPGR